MWVKLTDASTGDPNATPPIPQTLHTVNTDMIRDIWLHPSGTVVIFENGESLVASQSYDGLIALLNPVTV